MLQKYYNKNRKYKYTKMVRMKCLHKLFTKINYYDIIMRIIVIFLFFEHMINSIKTKGGNV